MRATIRVGGEVWDAAERHSDTHGRHDCTYFGEAYARVGIGRVLMESIEYPSRHSKPAGTNLPCINTAGAFQTSSTSTYATACPILRPIPMSITLRLPLLWLVTP